MRRTNFRMMTIATATVSAVLLAVTVNAQELPAANAEAQKMAAQDLSAANAQESESYGRPRCKTIRGELVEQQSTTGCKPEHTSCFLGEMDANHGLRGTTYFKGDANPPVIYPPTAPTFRGYTGNFEYITRHGTLFMKEVGFVDPFNPSNPLSGIVNAYQRVVAGTDDFEGATGHLFVGGTNRNGRVLTTVHGVICKAPR